VSRGLAAVLVGGVAGFIVLFGLWRWVERKVDPVPETIAAASLQGLREQNRLSAFAARFVAVVTSTQTRFGLSARLRQRHQLGDAQPHFADLSGGAAKPEKPRPANVPVGVDGDL